LLLRTEARETLAEPIPALPPLSALLLNVQVLVVDDEADTRELTAFVLEQVGAIVTAVPSAIEALEVFAQSQPDVLVSDIGMPEMDGALMRQIRQLPEQVKPIPAVALTAYAGEVDQQQAIAAGFKVTCPSLLTQMHHCCDRRLCERRGSVGVTTCNTKWSNLQSGYFQPGLNATEMTALHNLLQFVLKSLFPTD